MLTSNRKDGFLKNNFALEIIELLVIIIEETLCNEEI